MKLIIVSVRDRAANAYGRPIFVPAIGSAIRSFQDEVNREAPDNQMFSHPDDFDLYELGVFDDESGTFSSLDQPRMVAVGKQMKSS